MKYYNLIMGFLTSFGMTWLSSGKMGGYGGGEAAAKPSLKTLTICHSERSEESLPGLLENADLTKLIHLKTLCHAY